MSGRRGNGEGTVFQRPNGRWAAQGIIRLVGGGSKRITVTAATRPEANARLQERLKRDRDGFRTPEREQTVGEYLDYWLQEVVPIRARPTTIYDYSFITRKYLKPGVGKLRLSQLSPRDVQKLVNDIYARTGLARTTNKARATLRAALGHAEREELVLRNAASRITVPKYQRKNITPWTPAELERFLEVVKRHRWYGAFLILATYGARRGEVLGLPWKNIDFEAGTIRIDQQLQRIDGKLTISPVKTEAGQRVLPLSESVRRVLGPVAPPDGDVGDETNLVFRSTTGTGIDPQNFTRQFQAICAEAGLPRIRLHDLRHTTATLLKKIGVPDRDIQHILGHADITTTQQIYQHADMELESEALNALGSLTQQQTASETAAGTDFSTGQGTENRCADPWQGQRDSNPRRMVLEAESAHRESQPTPVNSTPSDAHTGLKLQQTAAEIAALAKQLDRLDSMRPHQPCPHDHSTGWLIRELHERLNAQVRDLEGGGDLAA
ncbi:tyrosine-type recombinase/integrase [Nocardioides sp. WG-D5]